MISATSSLSVAHHSGLIDMERNSQLAGIELSRSYEEKWQEAEEDIRSLKDQLAEEKKITQSFANSLDYYHKTEEETRNQLEQEKRENAELQKLNVELQKEFDDYQDEIDKM
ncbi:hypothetical protein MKX01_018467 [Papaver californicum]|nr:hypothetical protein MKX01_018467 [Papaver californicum]